MHPLDEPPCLRASVWVIASCWCLEYCANRSGVSHGGTKARSLGSVLVLWKSLRGSVAPCEQSRRAGL